MSARRPFLRLLDARLKDAHIVFHADGGDWRVGNEAAPCAAALRVHRERFFSRALGYGNLGVGEAFMDEDFAVEQGTLPDFLTVLLRNGVGDDIARRPGLLLRAALIRLRALVAGAGRSVRAHYDLGPDLFASFLDATLTYSCGYALTPHDSLEQLQEQKLDRICRKLRLGPGCRMLDIGCGFGGLLIFAAQRYGAGGVGVTLSRDQQALARERVAAAGLSGRIDIRLADFAAVRGPFDRVVSVGMIEHLRAARYQAYFRHIASVLAADGVALVHGIARTTRRNRQDAFIQKYVFPRSDTPSLSQMVEPIEASGMAVVDVDNVGPHYAPTLAAWLARFLQNRHTLDPRRYDARFQRMWEYYLSCGLAAARASDAAVYQVLFTRDYPSPRWMQRI